MKRHVVLFLVLVLLVAVGSVFAGYGPLSRRSLLSGDSDLRSELTAMHSRLTVMQGQVFDLEEKVSQLELQVSVLKSDLWDLQPDRQNDGPPLGSLPPGFVVDPSNDPNRPEDIMEKLERQRQQILKESDRLRRQVRPDPNHPSRPDLFEGTIR